MPKQLYNASGKPIAMPESLADAKRYRRPHFDSGEECSVCISRGFKGMISRKLYTDNSECVHCSTLNAMELQVVAIGGAAFDLMSEGSFIYESFCTKTTRVVEKAYVTFIENALLLFPAGAPTTRDGAIEAGTRLYIRDTACARKGHLGITTLKGECYYCRLERDKITPFKTAVEAGEEWYTPNEPCGSCGEVARRRTKDKKCSSCSPRILGLTPRQKAVAEGSTWYTPNEPCIKCGTKAPKRVNDGKCKGCLPAASLDARSTPDSIMMEESPDLIVSRNDARRYGFKVYRTGEKCTNAHVGFRYVSTGNCIECLRKR